MENHTNKTYQERMNKTASSKFGAIEKHLEKGVKLLDFGSGFSPEFIEQVQQTGAHYVAYDVSNIVQNQLKENDIDFLTKEQLKNTEDEFDVIYLSSVFHELMSYLSRPKRRETFAMLDKVLKSDGVIIIRDWGYVQQNPKGFTSFEVASSAVNEEVHTWIKELAKNSIIEKPDVVDHISNGPKPDIYVTTKQNIYEIMLHTVWGLGSLEREAQETYSVTPELINKWICQPYGYRNVKFELKEYDETYLPYLQKYFKIDELPWPTKIIYELRKTK